jgi:hypothetical protein
MASVLCTHQESTLTFHVVLLDLMHLTLHPANVPPDKQSTIHPTSLSSVLLIQYLTRQTLQT